MFPGYKFNVPKVVEVYCGKCLTIGVWVDHGPITGRGWYCRQCKIDISHEDNVWGSCAKEKTHIIDILNTRETLNCLKPNCNDCFARKHISVVNLNPGDTVVVDDETRITKYMKQGDKLKVKFVDNNKGTIHVIVGNEYREYRRCRFSKLVS